MRWCSEGLPFASKGAFLLAGHRDGLGITSSPRFQSDVPQVRVTGSGCAEWHAFSWCGSVGRNKQTDRWHQWKGLSLRRTPTVCWLTAWSILHTNMKTPGWNRQLRSYWLVLVGFTQVQLIYTTIQVWRSLMLNKVAFIYFIFLKYCKNIVKNSHCIFTFSHHSSHQCHMIIRNHSNVVLEKYSYVLIIINIQNCFFLNSLTKKVQIAFDY